SNLGSSELLRAGDEQSAKTAVETVIRTSFRPEFINRIDEIIVFHRLGKTEIAKIVQLQLSLLSERLAKRNLTLLYDDALVDLIADVGYNPDFGARPIKRTIQNLVENPMAKELLSGLFTDGDTIELSVDSNNEVMIKRKDVSK
ncbi:MAG: type VI secretion system ATPase TssH, partial [Sphaerochaetaceae bacterium]